MISFNLNCIMQLKQFYNVATKVSSRKKCYYFWWSTVYPKKYAHGFVVLCFVVVMQSFIINSHEVFIHIHQGCFAGTGAIVRLPQCQWSKPDGYGKISQCITTTKHSKAKNVCIFLGIYCTWLISVIIGVASREWRGFSFHPPSESLLIILSRLIKGNHQSCAAKSQIEHYCVTLHLMMQLREKDIMKLCVFRER